MRSDGTLVSPLRISALPIALMMLAGPGAALAQSHTLLGTVRDDQTGRPIAGARVTILGTSIMADTDGVGRYQLHSLSPGPYRVRIEHLGHATSVEEVTLTTDSLTVAHFHLPVLAATWARLTMRATSPTPIASPTRAPEPESSWSVADLLDRQVPGLGLSRGSGQVGSGIRFMIRGVTSFTARGAPLVYIDGIRVDYALGGPGIPGLAGLSVLDQLNPSMIERVEVLKGVDATAYGLNAGNGVILVTTRGR